MKVLFVGLGGIGQRHLRNLCMLLGDKVEILAYRERRQDITLDNKLCVEPGVSLEDKYKIKVFQSLREALREKPEIVFITNPTSKHIACALEAVEAGCDLFIEKPLSHNGEGLERLAELVEKSGRIAFVGYQNRYHPCVQKTKQLLVQGTVGDIVAVNAEVGEYLPGWHKYEDYRKTYAAKKNLGGGVILSQIHEFDYLYYFFGLPHHLYTVGGKLSALEIDVEDMASTLMEYTDKDTGRYFPAHVHQDYLQNPAARTCKILGKKGMIAFDLIRCVLTLHDDKGEEICRESYDNFDRNDMFLAEMRSFLNSVENRTPAEISIRDGVASMKMALSAKKSMETKSIVSLACEDCYDK